MNGQAQTVYNPQTLQFDSPDHATAVSYKVELWLQGVDPATGAPISTFTLAKDKVVASGLTAPEPQLKANLSDLTPLFAYPSGQFYVARLVAVGVTPDLISARSTPSNPFARAVAPLPVVNLRIR